MNGLGEPATSSGAQPEPGPIVGTPADAPREGGGPRTLGEAIRAQAEARPDGTAIVGSDFGLVTFRDLQEDIIRVRGVLRAAGYDRNARVAVAIADSAQSARAIVAVSCCASSIPIDPKLTRSELERCWAILRPSAVVLLRGAPSIARSLAERDALPILEADFAPGLSLSCPAKEAPAPPDQTDPDQPAFILHTSGTTGQPNLVPFSHRNLLACTERLRTWFGLTPSDRCLSVTPVYYSHALTTTVFPPLLTGGSIAFPSNPTSVDIDEWFFRLAPTWCSAGPTLHLAILEKVEEGRNRITSSGLRFVSSAGAPLSREIYDRMELALGVPVLQHYGSSETAQVASNVLPPGPSKFGTCGFPWPGILKIADPDGRPLPPEEVGEVFVRGPSVASGYLNDRGRPLVGPDGWYRTGDLGSLDRDGFLTLHGRGKELINRGGEKISPVEIDQALLRHPQVAEAAAFGVPHPRLGEDVAAAVVLRPGATIDPPGLRDFLAGELAAFKTPRRITIVSELPRGITGKVQRQRLSETLRARPEQSGPSEESLQAQLATLWQRVLKKDRIGLDEDFFETGGDSLLAMDVSLEMQRLLGRELSESLLFEAPTIRDLARRLSEEGNRPPQ